MFSRVLQEQQKDYLFLDFPSQAYLIIFNNILILGLKPISNLVFTQGNAMLLICVLNEAHDTTKVLLQYNKLFIY